MRPSGADRSNLKVGFRSLIFVSMASVSSNVSPLSRERHPRPIESCRTFLAPLVGSSGGLAGVVPDLAGLHRLSISEPAK